MFLFYPEAASGAIKSVCHAVFLLGWASCGKRKTLPSSFEAEGITDILLNLLLKLLTADTTVTIVVA